MTHHIQSTPAATASPKAAKYCAELEATLTNPTTNQTKSKLRK